MFVQKPNLQSLNLSRRSSVAKCWSCWSFLSCEYVLVFHWTVTKGLYLAVGYSRVPKSLKSVYDVVFSSLKAWRLESVRHEDFTIYMDWWEF